MKSLQILGLLIILGFSSATLGQERKKENPKKSQITANSAIPNPFRLIGFFFKRIFEKPSKDVGCCFVGVEEINLDTVEITNLCSNSDNCAEVTVITNALKCSLDDVLNYKYEVSAGRIIGKGEKVIWDLSGVKPGTYTITAAVDDGCGFCGKTQTKTVTVKE